MKNLLLAIIANALSDKGGADSFKNIFRVVTGRKNQANPSSERLLEKAHKSAENAEKLKLSDERVREIKDSFKLYRENPRSLISAI